MNTKLIPFDFEKAKSGAKVVCRDGAPFEAVAFNGRGKYPVIGYIGDNNLNNSWTLTGRISDDGDNSHADLMLSISTFPDPPEGEEWSNPYNLTPEQVGEGYRLLLKSEVKDRTCTPFIEIWYEGLESWHNRNGLGYRGDSRSESYRVPASTPFHWDKPKEPVYRPFTFEEVKEHVGKVVKSKDGEVVELIIHAGDVGLKVSTNYQTTQSLMDFYTFLDGSPCGVLVEN